jgi:hypothetical protein
MLNLAQVRADGRWVDGCVWSVGTWCTCLLWPLARMHAGKERGRRAWLSCLQWLWGCLSALWVVADDPTAVTAG